jgi:hypothetical protein
VTTTLSGNGATDTFTNLPMYSSGGQTAYTYSVREVIPSDATYRQTGSIPGTGTSEDPFVITNTVNDEITSVSGTKTWNYPDATVAPAITINLYQDGGTDPIDSITLDGTADENGETSPWHYSFTGLHRYSFTTVGGVVTAVREIAYSVAEAPVEGYTSHKSGNNFTNTITGTTSLTVNKVWVDVDDATHGDITVQLCANGEAIEGVTATFSGSHTFEGLDQYDSDGKIISYSVTEDDIEGYNNTGNTVVRNEDGTFTVTLTNTLQQDTVTVVVKKTWKQPGDVTPPDVTFTLYADGEVVKDSHGDDMTLTLTSGTLTGSFSNLSKYKYVEVTITEAVPDDPNTPEDESAPAETEMQAVPIEYAVVETALSNYAQTGGDQDLDPTDDFEYDFTNTITGTTSVTVEKVWEDLTTDDDRTASATITLYRSVNGGEAEAVDADAFVTSKDETHTWSELPKYDGDGNLYTYTVQEAAPAGYSTGAITGTGTSEDPYQVTNTINQAYTTFTVTKTWIDGGSDSRPTITIKLWRSDNTETPYDTYEMHNTETTHTFGLAEDGETAALPVYNEGRTAAYTYYVTEDQVSGYDAPSIQGGSITNTLTQETDATKTVTKYWVDPEGTEHPDVTFRLSANGEEISSVTVGFGSGATAPTTGTLTSDTWSYTWTGLDKYDSDRELIDYTVSEDDVAGYTKADVTSDAGAAFRNTIAQDYITITGEKLWANMGGSGVNTPASVSGILVQLYQDGNAYGDPLSVPVDNGDGEADWSFSWSELEVYNLSSGSKYVYTVKEGYMNGETFVPVNGGGTITYGNDSYTVSYTTYESDHYYEITNTYQVPQQYYYRIDLNYSTFVEGTQTGSTYVQGTLQSSGTGGTVTADPDDYKVYNGLTYDYSADGSTLSVELEINQIKVITINYTHSSSGGGGDDPDPNPVYYTVQYTFSGSHPDATLPADETYVRNTKVQVADGYDDVTTADGVWHFNGWSRTEEFRITGNTTITGTWTFTPNETTIVEEEPPLGEPPVTEEPPVEIEEPEIPLGNLPQTGTAAAPVNPMWTLGMLALSFSLAAAGLTITFGRRKDEAQK